MAIETCSTCKFFKVDPEVVKLVGQDGWCQRFPPNVAYIDQASNRTLTRFSTTTKENWCGEHKPAPAH